MHTVVPPCTRSGVCTVRGRCARSDQESGAAGEPIGGGRRRGTLVGVVLAVTVIPAPAPIGALTLGVTGLGLALVAFGDAPQVAARAATRLKEPITTGTGATDDPTDDPPAAALAEAAARFRAYLSGTRRTFDLPLDWRLTAGAQRTVLQSLHDTVGFGSTVTYGELAARSGLGRVHPPARGVGAIMGSNPLPVVVPCHRVLGADSLGGFGGGRAVKEWLLALEGVLTASFDLD